MKNCYPLVVLVGLMIWSFSLPAAQTTLQSSATAQQAKFTVNTIKVSDIKATQAKCSFTIQGSPVNEKGVCFSNEPSPTINSKKSISPDNPSNSGTSIMSGLKANTKYYVRAYAKSGSEVFYGNELSFTTSGDPEKNSSKNIGKKVESKQENTK
jgi:hypothetical protein